MKAFLTGATGFLGSRLAGQLRARGDEVVAFVRSPNKAKVLEDIGCQIVQGDLGDVGTIRAALAGCDAAFHCAAIYEIGIPKARKDAMYETNVTGTQRVLDAAIETGTNRIVYVSTVNVFGNTNGRIVDETYERAGNGFLSCYDETKYLAHQEAKKRIEEGAPIIIVQPSTIYGRNDHSEIGNIIDQAIRGKLRYISFPGMGFSSAHVDDVAQGLLLAHDKGTIGESYVLAGETTTMRTLVEKASAAAGRKPPRIMMPTAVAKLMAPAAPVFGKWMGVPPDLREAIRAADGVTYWAKDDKARRELGYSPRDLEAGLRTLVQ